MVSNTSSRLFLSGRSYLNYVNSIKSQATRKLYVIIGPGFLLFPTTATEAPLVWVWGLCRLQLLIFLQLYLTKSLFRRHYSGPPTDSHGNVIGDKDIPITTLDTPEASSTAYKQKKLPAAYEALSRYGFKFTTYEER